MTVRLAVINKKKFIVLTIILVCIFCLGFLYSYFEAHNVLIREMVFADKDIPESFIGKKIIFISDTHCNNYFTPEDIADIVGRINERNPDFIFLGGDYVYKDSIYSVPFFREISNLKSKHGVYFVLGNHDYWEDAKFIQEGLANCGFQTCNNESYWIKEGSDSIKIGGVGDLWSGEQLIKNTVDDVKKEDFCILLSHNPDYMELMDSECVDMVLSGHTHGGQVTFFGLWAPIMPSSMHPEYMQTGQKYRYGWKEKDGIRIYITSGIGVGPFPFRFFASPEIVEITLSH